MIIDATGLKVGRVATIAAKKALQGETVDIINVEQAVFTGRKRSVLEKYQRQRARGGPHWGPHLPRMPDRFFRRIIRGMLPTDTPRGREAFKRVMTYIGNPDNKTGESLPEAILNKDHTPHFVTVGDICAELGGKP